MDIPVYIQMDIYWKCLNNQCKKCKNREQPTLKCQKSEEKVSDYQFEITRQTYNKIDDSGKGFF